MQHVAALAERVSSDWAADCLERGIDGLDSMQPQLWELRDSPARRNAYTQAFGSKLEGRSLISDVMADGWR